MNCRVVVSLLLAIAISTVCSSSIKICGKVTEDE